MKTLLIATKNEGKVKEISSFLKDLPVKLISLKDQGIEEDVVEDGKTYVENSQKKALYYAKLSGLPTISDDGGLEIEALSGAPGVKSRRWIGEDKTEDDLVKHLQKIIEELPENNRTAYFRTVLSFALPAKNSTPGVKQRPVWSTKGEVKGLLTPKAFSYISKGYPYRSFFYLPKLKKYYHEKDLSPEETKLYNHRWKALKKLIPIIKEVLSI